MNKRVDLPQVPQSCALIKKRICLTAARTSVPSAGLSAHSFSIKPVSRLMPSHRQLAAISPKTDIIPSVPMKQPSDAASVSDDTMMNSYRQTSHRKKKNIFFLQDISQAGEREHFIKQLSYTLQNFPS